MGVPPGARACPQIHQEARSFGARATTCYLQNSGSAVIAVGLRPFEFTTKEHNRLLPFMVRQSRPLSKLNIDAKFDIIIIIIIVIIIIIIVVVHNDGDFLEDIVK